jgi:hypothetical protein
MRAFTLAAAAAALFAGANAAIDPIVIKGQKFFHKNSGEQFFMRGVAYQQEINTNTSQAKAVEYQDPLADTTACKRDIKFLEDLKTNIIRVYAIDPEKNHDECMKALADAGIYVIADLSQPGESINREDAQWTTALFKRYTSVVDVMAKYDNTMGFFAGNEVSNEPSNTMASAFVKAAVRDTKAYIKSKNYRPIGVGYATNDDAEIREDMAAYFDCGDPAEAIDFWGYNVYSWCGKSSFKESGFDVRTKEFETYRVPVFFAEYGCNEIRPRLFTEVGALYGKQMTGVWSGGIVYMYFEEDNKYGLASIENGQVKTNKDFDNLKSEIAKVTPTGVKMNEYTPSNTKAAECPDTNSGWAAMSSPLPPAANAQACTCMMDSISCKVNTKEANEEDDYEDLFGTVCGYEKGKYCDGINRNTTQGPYGAYSMCSPTEQLSFAFNAYAKEVSGGCEFEGKATQVSAPTTAASCKAVLDQAGEDGTGTIAGGANTGGGDGAKQSKGAAAGLSVPQFSTGLFGLGMYVSAAVLSGMAIMLL